MSSESDNFWDSSDVESVDDPENLCDRGVSIDLLLNLLHEHNLENMTTREVVSKFVIPQTLDYQCSLSGLMKRSFPDKVSTATHYVIHPWDASFSRLVHMLVSVDRAFSTTSDEASSSSEDHSTNDLINRPLPTISECGASRAFFWIDFFAVDQVAHLEGYANEDQSWLHRDELLENVRLIIERTPYTCVFIEPHYQPILIQRSWCLFELMHALYHGREILLSHCPEELNIEATKGFIDDLDKTILNFTPDFETSQVSVAQDKEWLLRAVNAVHSSGTTWLNQQVGTMMKQWFAEEMMKLTLNCNVAPSISTLWRLGMLLDQLCHVDFAETYLMQSLNLSRDQLGFEHMLTLTISHDLACFQAKRHHRFDLADELLRHVLSSREHILGEFHYLTTQTRVALARLLQERFRHDPDASEALIAEAESLYSKSLKLSLVQNGISHMDTLVVANFLALLLQEKEDYRSSYILLSRIVSTSRATWGSRHEDVLVWTNNLAVLLQDMNQLPRSEALLKRTLTECEHALGVDHLQTLTTVYNLAECMLQQGRFRQAEGLFKRELVACQSVKGPRHPDTLSSLANMIQVLRQQNKDQEADELECELEERNHRHSSFVE